MCKSCEGKGYVESHHGAGNSWTPVIQQCPKRCNISGYSNAIQRRLNNPQYVTESPVLEAIPSGRPSLRLVHGDT